MKIKQDYMYQYNYLIVITSTDKDTFSLNTFLEDYFYCDSDLLRFDIAKKWY